MKIAGAIDVLDHGHVSLVESWGSDERIIEAARMSTQKGFEGWGPIDEPCPRCGKTRSQKRDEAVREGRARDKPCDGLSAKDNEPCALRTRAGDEKLLAYLWKNHHATPFEMAGATFEIQAPIFIFREWHRHRTQSYNEMSSRYVPLPDVCFLPDAGHSVARSEAASKRNKQAGLVDGAEVLTMDAARDLIAEEADLLVMVEDLYQRKLKAGFPKELARTHLTVSRYSRMRASANLRNWLAFLTLRTAPNAQWEIQEYARVVQSFLADRFPRTLALFAESQP
jgi:thymidylate synthase (FAD)